MYFWNFNIFLNIDSTQCYIGIQKVFTILKIYLGVYLLTSFAK